MADLIAELDRISNECGSNVANDNAIHLVYRGSDYERRMARHWLTWHDPQVSPRPCVICEESNR